MFVARYAALKWRKKSNNAGLSGGGGSILENTLEVKVHKSKSTQLRKKGLAYMLL